jgi:Sugar (pentulose and hexulose) kinases
MLLLGIDLGSSSVKASVIDGESGKCLATAYSPTDEMKIIALKPGWAEQDTEIWWLNLKAAINECTQKLGEKKDKIGAIGISYQMHGLVAVDKNSKVLRNSIIWCDSRAVDMVKKHSNHLVRIGAFLIFLILPVILLLQNLHGLKNLNRNFIRGYRKLCYQVITLH